MVRRHIDQTIETRNFRARNDGIETGVSGKSHKGRKSSLRGKKENAISGKQLYSVQEETLAVSATEIIVSAPKTQTQIDGRRPSKGIGPGERVLLEGKGRKRAQNASKEIAQIRRVIVGILPKIKITNLNRDAHKNSAEK